MESILKVFEKLLYSRLLTWAAARDLVPECQFGFRPRAGTLDAAYTLFTILVKYVLVKGSRAFVALIYFQKAFPSVNRALLLDKLGHLGVTPRFRQSLCSIFEGNTFTLHSGDKITREFPVSTGLQEGSVLSPLLFVLFVADMESSVLSPFSRADTLLCDPCLNLVPIPGLMYADNLVIICLSAAGLRERLRRLEYFAADNCLTVNVSKCEVVVFGKCRLGEKFRFKREHIPLRSSCMYLGVWFDQNLSGRVLWEAILQKFRAAVPTFFSLCRRLKFSRLDLVYRLANSLLFSLMYCAEFLPRLETVRQCESAWWSGVRSFYGLPTGVSSAFLALLFPSFSLVHKVTEGKWRLLIRATGRVHTLFSEAVVSDRGALFLRGRRGYTQTLKEWLEQLELTSLLYEDDTGVIRSAHDTVRVSALEDAWSRFVTMIH